MAATHSSNDNITDKVYVCVELTGGVAPHIAGLQDRRW